MKKFPRVRALVAFFGGKRRYRKQERNTGLEALFERERKMRKKTILTSRTSKHVGQAAAFSAATIAGGLGAFRVLNPDIIPWGVQLDTPIAGAAFVVLTWALSRFRAWLAGKTT